MSEACDIESVANSITTADDLVSIQELCLSRGVVDTEDRNGLIGCDVPAGVSITGTRSVLVQGSVCGTSSNPCRIRITGDLVVTGSVRHAQIHCKSCHLGGSAEATSLVASGSITVGGDLASGQLTVGDYEDLKRLILSLQNQIARLTTDRETIERLIRHDEKRLDRSCKATRTPLNVNMGKIIVHRYGQVRIDLKPIYPSLTDRSLEEADSVLLDFFSKGVVGVLTRSNRRYIDGNRAREKVFLQVLKNLRGLFMASAQRERIDAQISDAESQVQQLVDSLHSREPSVSIQGNINPGIRLEFVQPKRESVDDGTDFSHESATLEVQPGRELGQCQLQLVDVNGESCVKELTDAEQRSVSFRVHEKQISLAPLPLVEEGVAA
jgi:hypothetical protein